MVLAGKNGRAELQTCPCDTNIGCKVHASKLALVKEGYAGPQICTLRGVSEQLQRRRFGATVAEYLGRKYSELGCPPRPLTEYPC